MAAIDIGDCTVSNYDIGGLKLLKIVTPTTADDGDTISQIKVTISIEDPKIPEESNIILILLMLLAFLFLLLFWLIGKQKKNEGNEEGTKGNKKSK